MEITFRAFMYRNESDRMPIHFISSNFVSPMPLAESD